MDRWLDQMEEVHVPDRARRPSTTSELDVSSVTESAVRGVILYCSNPRGSHRPHKVFN